MSDVIWLAVLGGLFLATLAYLRLCDEAWDEPSPDPRRHHRARAPHLSRRRARPAREVL